MQWIGTEGGRLVCMSGVVLIADAYRTILSNSSASTHSSAQFCTVGSSAVPGAAVQETS